MLGSIRRSMVFAAAMLAVAGCGWSQYGGDPGHSGSQPLETKLNVDTVSRLAPAWTETTGRIENAPAIVGGVAYMTADGLLEAFDAAGTTGCTGTPKTCGPLWTASADVAYSSPAVVGGVVYVGSADNKLYAFDAAGVTGCSGSPKTCLPLWAGVLGGGIFNSSPTVANGFVYVGANDNKLYAFDATGATGCSGSPKTCAPAWTATTGGTVASSPAVVNGTVYVGSGDHKLYAYDAAGQTQCSGNPKTCAPLWSATTGGPIYGGPTVVKGVVYVGSDDHKLYAFDRAGVTNCSGAVKTCSPLWTATLGAAVAEPSVANGVVYVNSWDGKLSAFDATGVSHCSGIPKSCTPLWTAAVGFGWQRSALANGLLFDGTGTEINAYDASGVRNCSGVPKTCIPIWSAPMPDGGFSAAVVDGVVYVGGNGTVGSRFTAFQIPVTTLHTGFLDYGYQTGSPAASNPGSATVAFVEDPRATTLPIGTAVHLSCWVHGSAIYGGSDYWYRLADGPDTGDYIYYYFLQESGIGPGPNDFTVPTSIPPC